MSSPTPSGRAVPWRALVVALALAVVATAVAVAVMHGSGSGSGSVGGAPPRPGGSAASSTPSNGGAGDPVGTAAPVDAAPLPSGQRVTCPTATVTVGTARELRAALAAAAPGTSIHLADGVYAGTFTANTSGTEQQPVWLCGGPGAVLDGGDVKHGYGLHLAPAAYWRVVGLTVRNAQKGVVTDGTRGTVLQDLVVEQIGDEAIHLRSSSTGTAVIGCTVRGTGLRRAEFGEGVYVGSAHSNWTDGRPDRSDNDLVQDNRISDTTAESVDVKEGTTGGVLRGNTFDGSGTTAADSWVDVKGNDWLVEGNTGTHTSKDGFQVHQVLDDWGTGNRFRRNVARDRGTGVDLYVQKPDKTGNQVLCDNRDAGGGAASTNATCKA